MCHYKHIIDGMSEIFPLNDMSISYEMKFLEFNLWKGKCEHGMSYFNSETYCPSCNTKQAQLNEDFETWRKREGNFEDKVLKVGESCNDFELQFVSFYHL